MTTSWLDVSDITPRIGYTATASQTAFVVPFVFFDNSDLLVYKNDVLLTLDVNYAVTGAEDEDGGTVTLVTGATVGDAIEIARHVPIEQTTHIPPSGPLDIAAINIQFSKLIAIDQQTDDLLGRSLRQPDSEATVDMELPALRANKILGFDSNGAPVAVLGPSSVADQFVGAAVVESKAVAQVTDFAVTTNYLLIGGTTAAGDTPLAAYVQGTGTGSFTDGGGTSWKPVAGGGGSSSSSLPSAAGDGVTDDRAAIQTVIDAVAAAGGGVVLCTAGATYRVVINTGVTDHGLIIKDGVTLNVNEASINLECTGSVYGIRLQSNAHIIGPGLVKTTVSSTPGSQSIWHSPVSVGAAYGEVTSVAAVGSYINATNWSVRSLTLESVLAGTGAVFEGMGGVNHGLLQDLVFSSNSTLSMAIGFDHGTVGNLNAADIAASRVLFDANLAYSVFPHDITISRCKIGSFTKTPAAGDGGFGVRLSGCYKIKVEDVEVESSSYCGFFHTAGDFGFEFAPSNELKRRRYRGTTFKNCHVYDALTGYGFVCEAYADNIAAAVSGSGYSPLLAPINNTDILFEGCRTISSLNSTAGPGFYFSNMIGGTLRNCHSFFHSYGVQVINGCDQLLIDGGSFVSSYKDGIYVGDADQPEDIRIVGATCYSSGQDPGVATYAGIRIDAATRSRVDRCILGINGEGSQDYGLRVTTSAVNATLIDNNVLGVATSGVAYSLASATSYGTVFLFRGNVAASGIATVVGGLNIIPIEYISSPYLPYRRFITSRASVMSVTPAAGTWLAGDTVEFMDPLSGGYTGSKCTAAGTPGTWRNYGVIA